LEIGTGDKGQEPGTDRGLLGTSEPQGAEEWS
jgi:hypothetical protein